MRERDDGGEDIGRRAASDTIRLTTAWHSARLPTAALRDTERSGTGLSHSRAGTRTLSFARRGGDHLTISGGVTLKVPC